MYKVVGLFTGDLVLFLGGNIDPVGVIFLMYSIKKTQLCPFNLFLMVKDY